MGKAKEKARWGEREERKGRQALLGSDATRQPDRAQAPAHEGKKTERFPGWTQRLPSD